MKRHLPILLAAVALFAGAFAARGDDQDNSPEARLRAQLRNVLLQLRSVTADDQNMQAQVTDLQSQNTDLTTQLANFKKAAIERQEEDAKAMAVLKAQVSDQEQSIADLQHSLDQWKDSQQKAMTIATQTEAKRAKLAELAIHLQRVADDQKRKNDEMYQLGMEILDRYEKFGLGEALTAKEPFIGITRTRFETLVQDYEDKLTAQTITEATAPVQTSKP
ncbi:MAG: hypothetical protein ABSE62_08355 [Chthoniobacteraceae bacterium]|jgi:chromosome segregation ATPase